MPLTELPLPHRWMLLALEDESGKPQVKDSLYRTYALAGAFVAELQLQGRLVAAKADRFAITGTGEPLTGALGKAEEILSGRSPWTINRLLARLGNHNGQTKPLVLAELEALGAIRKEQDKLWILTWRTRWPTADPTVERTLVEHMRAWLPRVAAEEPPGRDDLLLSLLRCTRNLGSVWSEDELAHWKERIDERSDRAPIGRVVKQVTEAMRAAIAASAAGT